MTLSLHEAEPHFADLDAMDAGDEVAGARLYGAAAKRGLHPDSFVKQLRSRRRKSEANNLAALAAVVELAQANMQPHPDDEAEVVAGMDAAEAGEFVDDEDAQALLGGEEDE